MNVVDAAHQTVKAYPGGAESLGPRVGIGPAVLRSKVNPNTDTHHLSLAEADRIMGATGDYRILQALAAEHGFVIQKADEAASAGSSILQVLLAANAAEGEFDSVLNDALSDGKISPNEMKLITEAGMKQTSTLMALLKLCQAVQEGRG